MDFEKIISQGESETLEFKRSTGEWKEIINTISAFSNTKGGTILIGINSVGEIKGVNIGKSTVENITNKIKENTDPKIFPHITRKVIDDKSIIIIEVKESNDHLVLAFGRPFKRVGKSTVRMSKDEYERIILEKHKEKLYFDSQICKGATLEDIDKDKVKRFLEKARFERRLEINTDITVNEALKKLNIIKNSKFTNAAILLFGKNPQKFFLQAEARCARFKGTKPLEFIDMKIFGKNIIDQRENALEFVKEHIKLHAEIKGTERVEKWEYPIEAIREAITNAICHRDYKSTANVQVRIFDDRIEIWNPGKLLNGLTVEKLKEKHESIPRSPLLARIFFLMKYIEQWGTGTNRMVEWCQNYDLPEPVFEEVGKSFVVTIRKYKISEEIIEELSEEEKAIMNYLKTEKNINRKKGIQLLGVSKSTLLRIIKSLEEKELIKKCGKGKNIYYMLA